ncbi:MAG: discoidin domain-containing protein [Planctomycetota bacterium]|nr:discoidin domain-containing protein [Planctomycetota bacterium]
MVIVFCEKCGKRVPEPDMDAGLAVKTAEAAWLCSACAPHRAEKRPPPPMRTTSAVPILAAGTRRSGAAPASAESAAAHDTLRQKAAPKAPLALLIGAGVGAVCLLLGAAVLLSGGNHGDQSAAAPKAAKTENAALATVAEAQTAKAGVTVEAAGSAQPPTAGAGVPAVSLAERAKQAEKEMEAMRNRRAANLLAEHKAWFSRNSSNPWLYRNKLREFIASNRSTPVAAEAEKLLSGLKPLPAVRGRFVRIENLGRNRILSLAEVQVFSDGKNVAPAGKASQSSVACGGDPHRAIDGKTDGVYNNGSVTHTSEQENPWWEVDLGAEKDIEALVIWNRTEACMDRLRDFRVSVLDSSRKTVWETTIADIPNPNVTLSLSAK